MACLVQRSIAAFKKKPLLWIRCQYLRCRDAERMVVEELCSRYESTMPTAPRNVSFVSS
jgi:hypothetical protein